MSPLLSRERKVLLSISSRPHKLATVVTFHATGTLAGEKDRWKGRTLLTQSRRGPRKTYAYPLDPTKNTPATGINLDNDDSSKFNDHFLSETVPSTAPTKCSAHFPPEKCPHGVGASAKRPRAVLSLRSPVVLRLTAHRQRHSQRMKL